MWNESLAEFLRDKLVIAFKQAYDFKPDIVDIHLFNAAHYTPIDYCCRRPSSSSMNAAPGMTEDVDYHFHADIDPVTPYLHSLLLSKQFERWDLERTLMRPWGPA